MITHDVEPPLRIVRLDTGRMNTLVLDAVRALREALAEAEADPETRALVLLGRDDAFCAGLDNRALAGDDAPALLREMGELLVAIYGGRLPVVAGCAGHAVAAGAMLLLVSDVRVGAEGVYRVGFSEVTVGMPIPRLPVLLARDRLDRRHLQASTLLGQLWDPAGAVACGFLDRLVPRDELETAARSAAETLTELSPDAYRDSLASVRGETLAALRASLES